MCRNRMLVHVQQYALMKCAVCCVIVGYSRGRRRFLNSLGACSYHRHLCLSVCLCIRLRPGTFESGN